MENKDHRELRSRFIDALAQDAKANFEVMLSDSSDMNRRNYIRSLFALYEAIVANMRESIADRLVLKSSIQGTYNLHEIYTLMDETASINESGNVSIRYNQTPFKNLVKYVLKLSCREYQIEENIFDNGWNDFQASIQIRHKITHPKYESDISITDEELKIIENGRTWWNNTLLKIRKQSKNE